MKDRVYLITRVLVLIAFILTVIGFFLVDNDSQKSRFAFNAFQTLLFLIVISLPQYIEKKANVKFSNFLSFSFIVFCISHFILGEIAEFYVYVKGWDSLLHMLSGVMLAVLALAIVQYITKDNKDAQLSPLFTAIFAISFAVTVAVLWELVEFSVDGMFGSNMQRYMHSITGEPFVGRGALKDTMKDLFLDMSGALGVVVLWYLDVKRKNRKQWRMVKSEVSDKTKKVAVSIES